MMTCHDLACRLIVFLQCVCSGQLIGGEFGTVSRPMAMSHV